MKTIECVAVLCLSFLIGCGGNEPSDVAREAPRSESAPVPDLPQDAPMVVDQPEVEAPEPEVPPEPPKVLLWIGRCAGGGVQLWAGVGVNFTENNTSTYQEFTDHATRKRIQLEGQFSCIWEKPEGAE